MSRVLVVGAGPTGLTTALLLAEGGVEVRLIDKAPVRSDKSRALAVQARTLELLDGFDLAAPLMDAGQAAPATNLWADGKHVQRVVFDPYMPDDTDFGVLLFLSQCELEHHLEAALAERGVAVERPVELVTFADDGEGIDAVLVGPDGEEHARFAYIVGADGAHSAVRHQLDLPFEGAAYASDFMLADVVVDTELATDELQIFLGRRGLCVLFPLPGPRTRIIATEPTVEGELTLDRLADAAEGHVGHRWGLSDCAWLARFRLHHRGVPRYREGRAFVAGDAAHIHSPLGGQGMNTGIQDAVNLGWKLVQVLAHGADASLLDTYDAERQPVGERLLQVTDRAFQAAAADTPWFTGLRNTLAPWVVPTFAKTAVPGRVIRFVSQLGVRYRRSPLNGPTDGGPGPAPGERVPRVAGRGWRLLAWGGDALFHAQVDHLATCMPWLSVQAVPPRHGCTTGLALVRPDGHLAARSAGKGTDAITAYLRAQGLVG